MHHSRAKFSHTSIHRTVRIECAAAHTGLEHPEGDDTHIRIRSLRRHCDVDLVGRLLETQRLIIGEETRREYLGGQAGQHERVRWPVTT